MKVIKQICLEPILADKLKDLNASQLISELLDDYFNKHNPDKTINLKPLEAKIEELEQQKEEASKEIEHTKAIEAMPIDPLIKEWFQKIQEKPSFNSLVAFLDAHKLSRKDCLGLLKYYDLIHTL